MKELNLRWILGIQCIRIFKTSQKKIFFKCLFLTLDYLFVSGRYMMIPFSDCKGAYGALVPFDSYSNFLFHGSFKIIIKYVNMKFTSFFAYVQCANNKRFFQNCTRVLIDNSYFFAWQNISKVQGALLQRLEEVTHWLIPSYFMDIYRLITI